MNIAFFVNSLATEYPKYTTTVLAHNALRRRHSVCYVTPEDFLSRKEGGIGLKARFPSKKKFTDFDELLEDIQGEASVEETLDIGDIDVLLLRSDPSLDAHDRPWAAHIGMMFGQLAADAGVIVLNDPGGLGLAHNKLYFETFPDAVRADTLISKSPKLIREFVEKQAGRVILKPLQGSGGKDVFLVKSAKEENFNQIIETVSKEGYVIAQAYLPKAKAGDIRLFIMNGRPLEVDGKYAAIRRVPAENEIRSNMHAKGKAAKVDITERELEIVELIRPKLIQDGMFLVGVDIVGTKILEVNVFSPGALHSCSESQGVNFADCVIDSLEQKVAIRTAYGASLSNREIATL